MNIQEDPRNNKSIKSGLKVILTGHTTSHHKVAILLLYGGDLVSLITFEGTILYQAVSCFRGKKLPLVFQSVMYLYFKNVQVKRNEKMKGHGVVTKLLFWISVYEVPLLL